MLNNNVIVAELAGKDSIAAIIEYAKNNKECLIIPTIVIVPSEEQKYDRLDSIYEKLSEYISELGCTMKKPIKLEWNELWWELNKPISELLKKYNFYSPCIACHAFTLYENTVGCKYGCKILTGERLSHNGKIKLNQNDIVLDLYNRMMEETGIEMVRPLYEISDTKYIDKIVKEFYNRYSIDEVRYMDCYMSGNSNVKSVKDLGSYKIEEYFNEFLVPNLKSVLGD